MRLSPSGRASRTLLALSTLVALGVPGCAPEEPPADGSDPPAADEASESGPAPGDGLQLAAGTRQASYAPGDSIRVVVRLANRLDTTRVLTFPTSQRYDLRLLTESGEEIYRWASSRAFLQVVGEERIAPGSWGPEWTEQIPAPDSAGAYRIQALVPVDGGELRTELPIRVEGG